jgi:protein-tyrosine-phosphatase
VKKNILFVCTGNSCRSVMAEGIFKQAVSDRADEFIVGSAGVRAMDGFPASAETIRVMKEHGIDVSHHKSRRLTPAMVRAADKILVMEVLHKLEILQSWPEAGEKVHLLTDYAGNAKSRGLEIEIPDPIQMSESFYKNVFQEIRECVLVLAEKFGVKKEAT